MQIDVSLGYSIFFSYTFLHGAIVILNIEKWDILCRSRHEKKSDLKKRNDPG